MKIKFPTGSTAENNQLLLPEGMLSIDIEKRALRLHDGQTQGGFEVLGTQAYTPPLGSEWTVISNIYPQGEQANYMSFANGHFITSLSSGTHLYVSTDAIAWTPIQTTGLNQYTTKVIYVDDHYYICGGNGTLARSTNLVNWTSVTTIFGTSPITDVTYANGLFVAVSSLKIVATSDDGVNWTRRTVPSTTAGPSKVYYADGKWVMQAGNVLLTSLDGITWTIHSRLTDHNAYAPLSLCFANGLWVVGTTYEYIATSTDLINWTQRTSGEANRTVQAIIYEEGTFLAAGSAGLTLTSKDGVEWTKHDNPYGSRHVNTLAYGNGKVVAATGGAIVYSPK